MNNNTGRTHDPDLTFYLQQQEVGLLTVDGDHNSVGLYILHEMSGSDLRPASWQYIGYIWPSRR